MDVPGSVEVEGIALVAAAAEMSVGVCSYVIARVAGASKRANEEAQSRHLGRQYPCMLERV